MVSSNIQFIDFLGSDLCNVGVACIGQFNEQQGLARIVLLNNEQDADKATSHVHSILRCDNGIPKALCNHFKNVPRTN